MFRAADFLPTVRADTVRGFEFKELFLIPEGTRGNVHIYLVLLLGKFRSNLFGDVVINFIDVPTENSIVADSLSSGSGSDSIDRFLEVLSGHLPEIDIDLAWGADNKRLIDGAVASSETMDQKSYRAFYVTEVLFILPVPCRPSSEARFLGGVLLGSDKFKNVHHHIFLLKVLGKHPSESSNSKEGDVGDGVKVPGTLGSREGQVYISLG